jgi:hypothetical protein
MIPLKINQSSLRLGPTWFAKMRLDLSPFINIDVLNRKLALAYYFLRLADASTRGARRTTGPRQFNGAPLLIANRSFH